MSVSHLQTISRSSLCKAITNHGIIYTMPRNKHKHPMEYIKKSNLIFIWYEKLIEPNYLPFWNWTFFLSVIVIVNQLDNKFDKKFQPVVKF